MTDALADAKRDAFMRGEGYRVLRVSNADVMRNVDGVIVVVLAAGGAGMSCVSLPPRGEGKLCGERSGS